MVIPAPDTSKVEEVADRIDGITFRNFKDAFFDAANGIAITAKGLATILRTSLVTTTTSAFAAFGGALAKGENAFAAFGKSILSSMGQMLIQFGSMLVTIGFGLSTVPFLFGLQGPAAIAAGIAAIVAGGALTALGGGGGGSSAGASGSSAGGSTDVAPIGDSLSNIQDVEAQEPNTQVTVVVQGNILDRRETGLEIAEVINEVFSTNGITIARGAIV